ncbi:hypothetical protein [Spiroplasma endosymbiont of Atherix ibis]|uniref:hypothetical protein n=1 Tax=Spiroplasma endosymbiont of Atherix ibis TaxID=3066291 RepID=UPI0030D1A4AB
MSEKIKVLKIKKNLQDEIEDTILDFPSKSIWFEENSDELTYLDFDKTISFKEKKTSKIDFVQNANSHFFSPNNQGDLSFNKSDIENKRFESINLVDKMIKPKNSNMRKEIINMRLLSYQQEQRDKDFLLNKLNVDLKPHNNFKNYNLVKKENNFKSENWKIIKNSLEAKINRIKKQIFSINKQLLKKPESKKEMEVPKILNKLKEQTFTNQNLDSKEKLEKQDLNNSFLKSLNEIKSQKIENSKISNNYVKKFVKENEKNITVKFNNENYKQNNDNSLINQINKKTLYNEMNTEDLKKFIKEENNNYSIPVVNNLDYTLANTIDDLEKAIRNLELEKKKIKEIFFDENGETTELLESLQKNAKMNKKSSLLNSSIDFDFYENWFDNFNDAENLAKVDNKKK